VYVYNEVTLVYRIEVWALSLNLMKNYQIFLLHELYFSLFTNACMFNWDETSREQ
jgi:hypothetical protein